jgi:hypothetical protein
MGDFSLDPEERNLMTGGVVIVENELETPDHTRLGRFSPTPSTPLGKHRAVHLLCRLVRVTRREPLLRVGRRRVKILGTRRPLCLP